MKGNLKSESKRIIRIQDSTRRVKKWKQKKKVSHGRPDGGGRLFSGPLNSMGVITINSFCFV